MSTGKHGTGNSFALCAACHSNQSHEHACFDGGSHCHNDRGFSDGNQYHSTNGAPNTGGNQCGNLESANEFPSNGPVHWVGAAEYYTARFGSA